MAVSEQTPVDELQAAYSITPPAERQAAVLAATHSFLIAQNLPSSDEDAAALYDTIVAGVTRTPPQTRIHRLEGLTIISLPDGLGLYLFGIDLPDRVFAITAIEEETITFRDTRGAFIATVQSPTTPGDDWLISDIRPVGAPQPSEGSQP
jgi:hypothetical protein